MLSMRLKPTRNAFFLMASLCLVGPSVLAGDFGYFPKGIDYWSEKELETIAPNSTANKTGAPPKANTEVGMSGEGFRWEKYLDPANKEFFKEGDYTPPEPFMELVRNPSDENLRMWFAYVDRKNELAGRLQERMSEYIARNGQPLPPEQRRRVAELSAGQPASIEPKRFRLRMYFDSKCPHCQKMFGTLADLQGKGFFTEARQIDRGNAQVRSLPFPTEMAGADEVKQKNVGSVPLLLIGDLKRKMVYRLTGFQTTADVLKAIQGQAGAM
jgi:hypothetical protein